MRNVETPKMNRTIFLFTAVLIFGHNDQPLPIELLRNNRLFGDWWPYKNEDRMGILPEICGINNELEQCKCFDDQYSPKKEFKMTEECLEILGKQDV
jgi:hypothetical protein